MVNVMLYVLYYNKENFKKMGRVSQAKGTQCAEVPAYGERQEMKLGRLARARL